MTLEAQRHCAYLCALVAVLWFGQPAFCQHESEARLAGDGLPVGRRDHAADVVDQYFAGIWSGAGLGQPDIVDDAVFLRRVRLAVTGIIPTADEVREFLQDSSASKRRSKVDQLLMRSRYADYWSFRLREWITDLREVPGQGVNTHRLYAYAHEALEENRGWDRIAADLVNSQGSLDVHGNANFGVYFDSQPNEIAEAAARLFLGVNLACAQCHDHPFEAELSQGVYWQQAAFFARIKVETRDNEGADKRFPDPGRSEASVATLLGGGESLDGGGGERRAIVDTDEGEVYLPDDTETRKRPLVPLPLDGHYLWGIDNGAQTRRNRFVEWMTNKESPYFARAAVNRYFLELTGRGFVNTVDGFMPSTKVRHEPLLDELATRFASADYDLKWLIRTIVHSRLFQMQAGPQDSATSQYWHVAPTRPLNSDQWHDSIVRATGLEEVVRQLESAVAPLLIEEQNNRLNDRRRLLEKAQGTLRENGFATRADALPPVEDVPDPVPVSFDGLDREQLQQKRKKLRDYGWFFRSTRGRARLVTGPTGTALSRMNGKLIRRALWEGRFAEHVVALEDPSDGLDWVFRQVLSRPPTADESQRFVEVCELQSTDAILDLMWALLQSSEFQSY
jgi:hypothetical protein